MTINDIPPSDEEVLEHFGVKGMRWGIRNDEDKAARKERQQAEYKSIYGAPLTKREQEILKAAGASKNDAEKMQEKYGEGTLSGKSQPKKTRFTEEQKDTAKKLALALGVAAGAWFLYHRLGKMEQDEYFNRINPVQRVAQGRKRNIDGFKKEWFDYINVAGKREAGWSKEMVSGLSDQPVKLGAGTIFKRVSTAKETTIRPGGFYAAHRDDDVNRYKAILPVYWKLWGKSATSGQIVNLKANVDINAPSPRETYSKFRSMMNDEIGDSNFGGRLRLRDYFPGGDRFGTGNDDDVARKIFPHFAGHWANEEHPATKHFFSGLKKDGYNAVVDMNDAGALAGQPMRLLDGNHFTIAGHTPLSAEAIADAQESIKAVAHFRRMMDGMDLFYKPEEAEAYIAHYGIPGMRWGHRKPEESGSGRTPGAAQPRRGLHISNQAAVTAAFAIGTVAVGAILLKRGNISVWNSGSTKTSSMGARIAGKILTKTGGVLVRGSTKVGKVGGKIALKGGKLAGKGALKGGQAGGRAAGRAIAQNGAKVYQNVIVKGGQGTRKVGSLLYNRALGRGREVADVVVKKRGMNPINLLLNTAADQSIRGR